MQSSRPNTFVKPAKGVRSWPICEMGKCLAQCPTLTAAALRRSLGSRERFANSAGFARVGLTGALCVVRCSLELAYWGAAVEIVIHPRTTDPPRTLLPSPLRPDRPSRRLVEVATEPGARKRRRLYLSLVGSSQDFVNASLHTRGEGAFPSLQTYPEAYILQRCPCLNGTISPSLPSIVCPCGTFPSSSSTPHGRFDAGVPAHRR